MEPAKIDELLELIESSIDYYDRLLAEARRIEALRDAAVAHAYELRECYPKPDADAEDPHPDPDDPTDRPDDEPEEANVNDPTPANYLRNKDEGLKAQVVTLICNSDKPLAVAHIARRLFRPYTAGGEVEDQNKTWGANVGWALKQCLDQKLVGRVKLMNEGRLVWHYTPPVKEDPPTTIPTHFSNVERGSGATKYLSAVPIDFADTGERKTVTILDSTVEVSLWRNPDGAEVWSQDRPEPPDQKPDRS